jgi:hypothetical protein
MRPNARTAESLRVMDGSSSLPQAAMTAVPALMFQQFARGAIAGELRQHRAVDHRDFVTPRAYLPCAFHSCKRLQWNV